MLDNNFLGCVTLGIFKDEVLSLFRQRFSGRLSINGDGCTWDIQFRQGNILSVEGGRHPLRRLRSLLVRDSLPSVDERNGATLLREVGGMTSRLVWHWRESGIVSRTDGARLLREAIEGALFEILLHEASLTSRRAGLGGSSLAFVYETPTVDGYAAHSPSFPTQLVLQDPLSKLHRLQTLGIANLPFEKAPYPTFEQYHPRYRVAEGTLFEALSRADGTRSIAELLHIWPNAPDFWGQPSTSFEAKVLLLADLVRLQCIGLKPILDISIAEIFPSISQDSANAKAIAESRSVFREKPTLPPSPTPTELRLRRPWRRAFGLLQAGGVVLVAVAARALSVRKSVEWMETG